MGNMSFIKCRYNTDDNYDKKHIVLWSGGCDSTLLLYELLDAYGSKNVIAVSYNYPWLHPTKAKIESNHREAFKSKMKLLGERFSNFNHHEFGINMIGDKVMSIPPLNGLPQAMGWLFMIPMYANENSYIYAGYVKDDDFSTGGYKHHYTNIFDSVNKLIGRENLTLRLPYVGLSKYEIISNLIKNEIYDTAWYCEMPSSEHSPCMECHPCQAHISSLTYLSMFSNDVYVKLVASRELDALKARQSGDECQKKIIL
jgi:7-cyano-7-deazaguanine synthase in queuosine biosynthesis